MMVVVIDKMMIMVMKVDKMMRMVNAYTLSRLLSGKDDFKKYWFVLAHGELSYYDSPIADNSGDDSDTPSQL